MKQPLVSVVVPIFNNKAFIQETIDTVERQCYQNIELIMVDDGSTDGSADIIKANPNIIYRYQENQGPAAAKNLGSQLAKGTYIAYLDADDLWAETKLRQQIEFMEANSKLYYTITMMKLFLTPGLRKPHWLKNELINKPLAAYLPSSLVVKRETLDLLGGFDETFKTSDEVDWFFRAKDNNLAMAILPEVLLYRRIHNDNLSNNLKALHKTLLESARRSIKRNTKPLV